MTTPSAGWRASLSHDLGLRLASGLALAAAAIVLTWWGLWPFTTLVLVVALLMAWEWGRIVREGEIDAALVVHVVTVVMATVLSAKGLPTIGVVVLLIGAIVVGLQSLGSSMPLSTAGVLYVGAPAIALVWFRSDPTLGFAAAMLVLLAVWATDTGAYFAGRMIGGARLWPRISPNKTWSGLLGGVAAAGIVSAVVGKLMVAAASGLRLTIVGVLLALVSQAGDLAESALKRERGVKDASSLIPGHGGFMDRVDGLVAAATAAAIYALLVSPNAPGQALLFGR